VLVAASCSPLEYREAWLRSRTGLLRAILNTAVEDGFIGGTIAE